MKAAVCKSLNGPTGLVIETLAEPVAQEGEAIVRVKAVGLNFADTLITRGKYQFTPDLPFSPGAEIAGVIEAVGSNDLEIRVGQAVMAYVNWGGAAEKIAVGVGKLIPLPDGVPMTVAAGLSVTYGTAIHGLADRGKLKAGETVVVTGAAGGAGRAAVEIA
jgi:NADPH2:quinone reductase